MAENQSNQPSQFQRILTALAISILVWYGWMLVVHKYLTPPKPATQPAAVTATQPEAESLAGATAPSTQRAASSPAVAALSSGQSLVAVGGEDTSDIKLGGTSKDSPYPMELE